MLSLAINMIKMSNTLYDTDFNLWIEKTIHALEIGDLQSIDRENLIEELKDLGRSEKNALESNLMILIAHLLKLQFQYDPPESMQKSWYNSIDEHRKRVKRQLKKTPSLKSYLNTAIAEAFPDSRDLAISEGKRASFAVRIPQENDYPLFCPFAIEQLLDDDFYHL
jgi:Domain of unknown function DUF29